MLQTVGLYLHIPFCLSKCAYCDFYSLPGQSESEIDAYLEALLQHIRETAPCAKNQLVDTVYFGGGTPSLLGPKRLKLLLNTLEKNFQLSKNSEITLEANPGTLTPVALKKIKAAGFNRLSLGVQSLDDDMLKRLGRRHTAQEALDIFDAARSVGFDNLSVDLMYGLPGQTLEAFTGDLQKILRLRPDHVSCYGLKLEENTPLFREAPECPSDDEQAQQYLSAVDILTEAGYRHYEISNFALPSRHSRHNMKTWNLEPYLGLGVAAHSDFGGMRWSHIKDIDAFIRGIGEGGELVADCERIPPKERAGEYIMLRLRTDDGISSNEYARLFKASFAPMERELERFEALGLAAHSGDRYHLTARGFLLSNRIIRSVLDAAAREVTAVR